MMVTFVSQCEKNALKKTRRVLDTFANRIGDNTWQTIITEEGLKAVQKLLRKTASKSTAVSCHWIRSRARSEFIWVVGNRDKFNSEGFVAVNSTKKKILNNYKESDWKYLPLIKALGAVAALFHDWGKASDLFQEKLQPKSKNSFKADPLRHEWVSCLLLYTFIKGCEKKGTNWLDCLINGDIDENLIIKNIAKNIKKPFKDMPILVQVIFWLIVSHHKLPSYSKDKKTLRREWQGEMANSIEEVLTYIEQEWGYENSHEYEQRVESCYSFSKGLLANSSRWIKEVKKWSQKLKNQEDIFKETIDNGVIRVVLHHTRLSLMLGDHDYSSQDADKNWGDAAGLFANTDPKTKKLKQKLDEHIIGVESATLKIAHSLMKFEQEPPSAQNIKTVQKLSPTKFSWQDKAVKEIKEHYTQKCGFFAVNMASTGCGKTFANAKIMQATSEDTKSLRYILALGLRTLTLQTGDEYREKVGLTSKELAVLIGSQAVFNLHKEKTEEEVYGGSESLELLLDAEIESDCDLPEQGLHTLIRNEKDKQLLCSPVLVCTIDHLMGAVETKRGGKYILPSLRLSSSDLVIDEIDDFSGSDIIAIGRLVYLAAMLGRKVMISSATIPPDLAEGYFNIYKKGWELFATTREVKSSIYSVWVDEFTTEVEKLDLNHSVSDYRKFHAKFIDKRVEHLLKQKAKRKADIFECYEEMEVCEFDEDEIKQTSYFELIKKAILQKHQKHHTVDKTTNIKVSFGVVRVANIEPCIKLSKYLQNQELEDDIEFRVMSYHSRQILLLRHIQEKHLDEVLKRKEQENEEPIVFSNKIIRDHLDSSKAKNIVFILVATPVEEVGRDHDFDWAVVEPSSYRSIVQLAGRVRRHREGEVKTTNITLMQYNYKAFKSCDEDGRYFQSPGYENSISLKTHDIKQLLNEESLLKRVDAIPRIKRKKEIDETKSLADLEHYEISKDLTKYEVKGADTIHGFLDESWYLTAHPQIFHGFRVSAENTKIYILYDEQKEQLYIAQKDDFGEFVNREGILSIEFEDDSSTNSLWLERDYLKSLKLYAQKENKTIEEVSKVYGELSFIYSEGAEYRYSDQYGLMK